MSVTGRRSSRQSQPSRDPRPNDICIAILGATGSGKSSFISKYSGKPVKISHNLNACTSTIDVYAYDLSPSRTVYLIDTPGFDDIKSDSEVLEELKTWLENSYRKHIRLNGIIYLHRITDIRMQASAKRNLMIFHELCGQDFLKKVILVTTMWDQISTTKGVKRENYLINEPAFWGFMLKKGSSLHRHDNTRNSAMEIVHRLAKIDMPATTELQAMEARKIKLSEDHPDTPTNIANQTSTNRNQGQLGEVELEVQMIEISKPIFGLERFEALNPSSGPVTHNKHVEFEDSDSSSSIENASVFSLPMSIPSTSSLDSGKEEINSLLIRQFANLLCEDGVLVSILSVGISNETIGYERMRNNFRRLLKHFANDLKTDIFSASHQDLRSFVNSYSTMITRELFAMTTTDKEGILKLHILDTDVASDETRLSHEMKVEFYLQNLRRGDIANPDEESDQDSVTEEAGEDEPYEGSLQNLDQMKHFILESAAYQIFRRRLEEFVQPSLYSRVRDLVMKWSTPGHKNHADVSRYKLRSLVTELQHVHPHEIQFGRDQNISLVITLLSHYQHAVERWTGERWDWWPLLHCQRPLGEAEIRLRWKCVCGEERWAEVPDTFAKRLHSIIRSLPKETVATQNPQPPGSHTQSDPTRPSSAPDNNMISNPVSHQGHSGKNLGSSSNPSVHRRSSGPKANIVNMATIRYHVLFLVKQGGDYRLAQICVSNTNCQTFFSTMRKEYFRLRGTLRGRFSVWRYSHCDFYKLEKFDDHEFALKMKDSFPDHGNTDYEYNPRPMDTIPPISEHEFTKRFYACHTPRPLLHLHHKCRKLGAHSSDILKLLPKKRTELEEAGDKREDFWGIYAREIISLRWILFYNFVCVSPLLAFFVAWIVARGHDADLQNPSIPLSVMVSMLSLFWIVFLSSLQFGQSH